MLIVKDNSPKVSIVLPTHNGAKYISQSIDSCLNQTYKNIELIIVDDGSTDETPKIIGSYKDKRIKVLRHAHNKGLAQALNTGFARASGEYLTWTSDDNFYADEAIVEMTSFLTDQECEFVYCDYYYFDQDSPSKPTILRKPDFSELGRLNIVGACFLYSRRVKETVGDYDPAADLAEDYDYWLRVSRAFSMCHLKKPLYFFRLHEKSLTSRFLKQYQVQLATVLVQTRNKVVDAGQATRFLIELIAEKKVETGNSVQRGPFVLVKLLALKRRILILLYRLQAGIRFAERISQVLEDFDAGRIDTEKARALLGKIVNEEE